MRRLILPLAVALLVIAPATATACSLAYNELAPRSIARGELRIPVTRESARASWKVGPGWTSALPTLNQFVRTPSGRLVDGAALGRQHALRFLVTLGDEQNQRLESDDDAATPECALAGKLNWEDPRLLVHETSRMVMVTAVTRPTPGDRTGCVLVETGGAACEGVVNFTIRLHGRLGSRRIYTTIFGAKLEPAT